MAAQLLVRVTLTSPSKNFKTRFQIGHCAGAQATVVKLAALAVLNGLDFTLTYSRKFINNRDAAEMDRVNAYLDAAEKIVFE